MSKNIESDNIDIFNNKNNSTDNVITKGEKFYSIENYENLRNFQNKIYKKTGFTPSFQKIINSLITEENLNQLELTIINKLNLNNL